MTKLPFLFDFGKKAETASQKNGMITAVITPEMAKKLLANNKNNRTLSKSYVKTYAGRMLNGEWRLNGQAIIIDSDGNLLDGQHRLAAVVQAGIPVEFDVRFGVDRECFTTIDDGKKRTFSDTLSASNTPNANTVAAAIRLIVSLESGRKGADFDAHVRLSNDQYFEWYEAHTEIVDFAVTGRAHYMASQPRGIMSASEFTAFYYVFYSINKSAADSFITKLARGTGLDGNCPVFHLRSRLIDSMMLKNMQLDPKVRRGYILTAWKAYVNGKSMKRLRYDPAKGFPNIFD